MNMSNDMFGGSQKQIGFTKYTGLAPFKVVMVNPTEDEWKAYTDRDAPYEFNYDFSENPNTERQERPVIFWVEYEGNVYPLRINIAEDIVTTKDEDKFKFINRLGQVSYFAANADELIQNENISKWFNKENLRKVRIGEEAIHMFLQRLICYSSADTNANWMSDIENNAGFTFESLLKGDLTGIRNILNYANSKENRIGLLFCVKHQEEKDAYWQEICSNPETFSFISIDSGTLPETAYTRLEKLDQKYQEQGRKLTNRLYTVRLQKFNPNDFVEATAEAKSAW